MADPEHVIRRTRDANARFVVEQLRGLGLTVHPASRIMRQHDSLQRGLVPFSRDCPVFAAALEAERDMQQLGFFFDQANAHRTNPEFKQLAKRLLKDTVLPQDSLDQSPGRDAQFELYIAAICQNAKLLPVDCAEPDVTCFVKGRQYGIAAKRIKNTDRTMEHVSKAAQQIRDSGMPGIIALELSLAVNRENRPIISRIESQLHDMIYVEEARAFFRRFEGSIMSTVAGKGVLGVVIFTSRLRLRTYDEWGLDGMSMWLETTDPASEQAYKDFYAAFIPGIPNVEDRS